jgi:putative serine protease PepD
MLERSATVADNKDNEIPEYSFPEVRRRRAAEEPSMAQVVPDAFVKPEKKPGQNKLVPLVAVAAVAALVGGVSGAGVATYLGNQNSSVSTTSQSVQGITINDSDEINQITAVAAKASPSVVTISVSGAQSGGSGSGVIVSRDGYVLTNNHVVTLDGATESADITLQDNDGNIYSAEIVGTDPTVDLAVLKIDSTEEFTPIEWADSSKLNVGDLTIAMGAPLGLAGTVTTGIVSALNRSIQIASSAVEDNGGTDSGQGQDPFDFFNFDLGQEAPSQSRASSSISIPVIQTDAAINPGNSGGALLDAQGRLIGINVAIASAGSASAAAGSIGVGFALPSNLALRVSEELIENQTASHGLLGAQVSDAAAKSGSTTVGAYIEEVVSGGAAQKAGVKAGDIVTQFNGVRITDANDLTAQVRTAAGGSDATMVINRDGKTQTIKVTLGTL